MGVLETMSTLVILFIKEGSLAALSVETPNNTSNKDLVYVQNFE